MADSPAAGHCPDQRREQRHRCEAVSVPEDDPVPHEATPGELLAITHGMFMAWALSEILVERGSPANELVVETECAFTGPVAERELVTVDLRVRGRVPGLEEGAFDEAVTAARTRYLRSAGIRDRVSGELSAALQPSAEASDSI